MIFLQGVIIVTASLGFKFSRLMSRAQKFSVVVALWILACCRSFWEVDNEDLSNTFGGLLHFEQIIFLYAMLIRMKLAINLGEVLLVIF